jgi:hypothetical protein
MFDKQKEFPFRAQVNLTVTEYALVDTRAPSKIAGFQIVINPRSTIGGEKLKLRQMPQTEIPQIEEIKQTYLCFLQTNH